MTHADRQRTFEEFEAILRQEAGLSDADRAAVMREVRSALDTAPAAPELDIEALRASWMQLVDDVGGELDASEREALQRRIDQALQPLQARAVQDAVEYERLRRERGDEAAGAWLAEQRRARPAPTAVDARAPVAALGLHVR